MVVILIGCFVEFTGNFTPEIYAEDCLFEDPTIKFRGDLGFLLGFLGLPPPFGFFLTSPVLIIDI